MSLIMLRHAKKMTCKYLHSSLAGKKNLLQYNVYFTTGRVQVEWHRLMNLVNLESNNSLQPF